MLCNFRFLVEWIGFLTKLETGLFHTICYFPLSFPPPTLLRLNSSQFAIFLIGWGGFFISSIGLTGFGRFKGRSVVTQFAILLIFQIVFHFGPEVCFFDQPHIKQQINQEGLCLSIHPHHQFLCQTLKPENKK